MPEYLSNKKRKQSIGINSYSEYTDTTKIIGNVLVGFGSVGVGTTVPTQDVDVNTIRVRDTLFDYTNSGGEFGYYLVKDTGGIKWVAVPPIDSNAIFVAENNNILGVSSFTGLNIIADELLSVTPNTINPNFADITILPRWLKSGETGIYTTKNVGIGTTIPTTDFQVGFGTTGVTIDGSVGVVSALGYYGNYAFIDQITVNDQLNVVGLGSTLVAAYLASAGGITTTGGDLYVGGSLFADKLDIINLKVVNIEATGITTLNVGIVSTFRVTGVSTLGVTSISQLNVSGITTLGITSTKDLFVDENLYVVGIATATRFSTGAIGSAINITSNTISGPAEIIIDPADVGDNSGAVRIKGDLFVDGEEFIVNSTTIELADFNVGIASTVGTNFLLDGAGIGIGSTNIRKTLTYDFSSDALKSSENFDLETGKVYKINETEVLSSTQLTVANINATGVSTLGFATIGQLYVSGVSTFVGVGTFINDLYVGGDLYVADDIFFDELNAKNANITGITTLNVGIVSTFRVTGVSTLGITSISQLYVSGVSTFVGVGTFINDLYVGEVLYADVVTGLTSTRDLLVDGNLRVTGISTLGVTTISQLNVSGITTLGVTTISQLNVSGITTLGVTSTTNLTSQQLIVSGITTLGVTSTTNLTSQQLNVSGITTLGITTAQQLYVSGVSTFVGVGTFIDDLYVGKVLYAKTVDFDNIEVENIKATGISTLNVGIVSTLTVTGVSTLGVTSATNLTSQQLNVSGITTLASIVGTSLSITGISTIANFLMTPVGTGATVGGIGVTYYGDGSQLTKISSSSGYADNAGIATNVIGGIASVTSLNVTGITTLASIVGTSLSISGISTLGITSTTNLTSQQLNVSGITTLGVTTISQLYVSGVSTFSDRITGIISTATKLENQRTFEITGDVVASPIFFDGTGNVSLAATIQPNSVGLGTDTFGDYVKDITGTANQIIVTGGTGEGSSPILSIPNQFNVPQDLIVIRDVQINRDLNVNGNITVGGTAATLFTQTFKVYDSDIILGVRTDGNGNDISTDSSANHGGIAIASTEGNPLIILTNQGIGETLPATYKKIMWFKEGSFAGLGTDAWLSNYALGVGTTELQAGTVLAAGSVQFSKDDLKIVRNINASGIITATEFRGTLTGYASSAGIATNLGGGPGVVYQYNTGITSFVPNATANDKVLIWKDGIPVWGAVDTGSLSGSIDYAVKAGVATYADNAGIATNLGAGVTGNIPYQSNIGITSFVLNATANDKVLIWKDGIPVWGDISAGSIVGVATYADRAGIADNVIGGIASVSQLNVSGITTLGITSTTNLTSQQLLVTGIATLASIVGTSLSITGISTIANFIMTPVGTGATVGGIGVTYYGDGSGLTNINLSSVVGVVTYAERAGIATNVIGGIASVTSLNVSGITTLTSIVGTSLSISGISTLGVTSTTNLTSQQLNVSGISTLGVTSTTNLTSQQLLVTGITTLASIVGTSLSISGISTIANFRITNVGTGATVGGVGVLTYYGDGSGLTNINLSSVVGVVTYADRAGIATNVIGGIASVTSLNVTGISTLGITSISQLNVSGITTLASIVGTSLSISGISTLGITSTTNLTSQQLNVSGITTLTSIVGTSLSITGISTIANFIMTPVGTGATVGGIGVVTYYGDGSGLTKINSSAIVGVSTYADRAGIATNVIGGIASVTSLDVSGITTLRSIVGTSLSITGISTIANFLITNVGTGATVGGIGLVTYYGDGSQLENIAVDYADRAGIATNVIGGIASVTSLDVSGITTLRSIVGTSLSITGISTIANFRITPAVGTGATVGGVGVLTYYGDGSGLTNINISSVVGVVTYADRSGIATNVIGGIASVTSLNVTGITTLASIVGTSLSITGISTIANFRITNVGTGATVGGIGVTYYGDGSQLTNINSSSIVGVITYADRAGIATNVIGGIASVTSLDVSGITTLRSIVGTSLSITGISTIANFRITSVGTGATVGGVGVLTYYGDGSQLTGLIAGVSISTNTANQSQLIPYVTGTGSTTGFGVTTLFTYNPFSGNLGIGTTTPTSKLTVVGDVLVSGILTAARIVGTSLSISGISTFGGNVNVGTGITMYASTGIISATAFYGNGENLSDIIASKIAGITVLEENTLVGTEFQFSKLNFIGSYVTATGIGSTATLTFTTPESVIGGIASVTSLNVTGISTLGSVEISSGIVTAKTGIVTYYGDGSKLTGVSAFSVQQQSITASPVYPTFANGVGVSSIGIAVTQVAYIPASGNLGIGTTTPLAKLDVRGDVSIASTLGIGTVIDIVPYDTLNSGTLSWEGSAGQLFSITNNLTTGSIYSVNDVSGIPSIDVDANGTIQLGPYGGNIGLGTTNPTSKLHVVGDVRVSGASTFGGIVELDNALRDINNTVGAAGSVLLSTGVGVSWAPSAAVSISNDNLTNAERYIIFEDVTSGTVQTVNVASDKLKFNPSSGTLSATVFTSLSDRTQKEDIRPIENAIEIVNQLTGVRYNWKNNTNKPSIGLIAQDVEEVIPEVVVEMADGLKSVSYGNIVAVLIEAIKEQQVRIEELEDRLNA